MIAENVEDALDALCDTHIELGPIMQFFQKRASHLGQGAEQTAAGGPPMQRRWTTG